MNPQRRYDPDADAKDTRSIYGHARWHELGSNPKSALPLISRGQAAGLMPAVAIVQSRWQKTRGVYRFDPTLKAAILDMNPEKLSLALLARLPEWSVYIELGIESRDYYAHGLFVTSFIDDDVFGAVMVFVSTMPDTPPGQYSYSANVITGKATSRESFSQAAEAGRFVMGVEVTASLDAWKDELDRIGWGLTAYLCSTDPDIRNPREPKLQPARKRNNGPVRQWEVGYRFGAAFRQQLAEAEQRAGAGHEGERQRPRVHVRRAHWHTILLGPRDQERKREVRWFPPVIVNAEGGELPVTVWKQQRAPRPTDPPVTPGGPSHEA